MEPKQYHKGRTLFNTYLDNSQCLLQNCMNSMYLLSSNPKIDKVELCLLGNPRDNTEAACKNSVKCLYNKKTTTLLNLVIGSDFSTDYTNFHSKDISGFHFKLDFKSPLREMEVSIPS